MADWTLLAIALGVGAGAVIVLAVVAYRSLGLSGDYAKRLAARQHELEAARVRGRSTTARIVNSQTRPSEYQGGEFGVYRQIEGTAIVEERPCSIAWDVQTLALPKVAPDETVPVLVDPHDETLILPDAAWARATARVSLE